MERAVSERVAPSEALQAYGFSSDELTAVSAAGGETEALEIARTLRQVLVADRAVGHALRLGLGGDLSETPMGLMTAGNADRAKKLVTEFVGD